MDEQHLLMAARLESSKLRQTIMNSSRPARQRAFTLVEIFDQNLNLVYQSPPLTNSKSFTFDQIPLLDGTFLLSVGVHSHDQGTVYDWADQRHQFEVMNPGGYPGVVHAPFRVTRTDRRPAAAASGAVGGPVEGSEVSPR